MYEGQWVAGFESGIGILTDGDDLVLYSGSFSDGKFNGLGTFFYGNGDKYIGMWKEGLFHGPGTYISPSSNSSYDGEWQAGQRHGNMGVQVYKDGSFYAGSWRFGGKHGKGEFVPSKRSRDLSVVKLRGTWIQDALEGKGEVWYPDLSSYEGSFKNGKREGRGTYTFPHGQQYQGRWTEDAIDEASTGTFIFPEKVIKISEDRWILPLTNNFTEIAEVHDRAGFDKIGG
jgi:hypothetical protein